MNKAELKAELASIGKRLKDEEVPDPTYKYAYCYGMLESLVERYINS